MHTHRDYLRGR